MLAEASRHTVESLAFDCTMIVMCEQIEVYVCCAAALHDLRHFVLDLAGGHKSALVKRNARIAGRVVRRDKTKRQGGLLGHSIIRRRQIHKKEHVKRNRGYD